MTIGILSSKNPKDNLPGLPSTDVPADPSVLRRKLQLLAWIRVGLGAVSGLLAGLLPFGPVNGVTFNQNAYADIYIAVFIYVGSYYLAKYGLKVPLPYKDRNKMILQGIGGFVMMFLFFWILYTTLCAVGSCFVFTL